MNFYSDFEKLTQQYAIKFVLYIVFSHMYICYKLISSAYLMKCYTCFIKCALSLLVQTPSKLPMFH